MSSLSSLLFFSRGRGHGHAITDLALADELVTLAPDIVCHFASYSTGAAAYSARGRECHDLGLPEDPSFTQILIAITHHLRDLKPAVVIAHEEFAAVLACHLMGIPCAFISTWLPPGGNLWAETLAYANSIIILEEEGIFPVPLNCDEDIMYTGPVVRRMKYVRSDRGVVRSELGIEPGAPCWTVATGGWATEAKAPIAGLILEAFQLLPCADKYLFWLSNVAGTPLEKILSRYNEARVVSFTDDIEKYFVASDVVITKGTHGISCELASLGIPSISLSYKNNPIDEILVPRISSNIHLHAKATTARLLMEKAQGAARHRESIKPRDLHLRSAANAASILQQELRRLLSIRHNAERQIVNG